MKGELFEVKTAALLYLRGLNSNLEFHLGSNIEQARNFDDIVIKYRSRDNTAWNTCFIQLKHKERAWLDASMLTTYDRGGFSLKKYLKSFCEIKSKIFTGRDHDLFDGPFETCDFVIYTNAPMVRDLAERRRNNVEIGPVHDLLKTSQRNEAIVGFCEETDGDIYRELEMSGGCEAKEFLRKLKVFSGQPSEDKMDEVIKEELKVTCSDNMSDVDVIYRFFIEAVKQWWSEDEVNFLSHDSSLLEKALDQYKVFTISSHEKQTFRLNVKFNGSALEELKRMFNMNNYSVWFVVCVDTPAELGCTKVMQILREERGAYTFVGLETLVKKQQAVVHGWTTGTQPYLVVLCNAAGEYAELCEGISEVLSNNAVKHVVVVSGPDDAFARTLKETTVKTGVHFLETTECIELTEIDHESMDRILESHVYLQSRKLTLRSVLRDGVDKANGVVKQHLVEIMASSTPVSIGRDLVESIDVCTRRYLERRDVLHTDILKGSNRVSGVIAVSNASLPKLRQMFPPGSQTGTLEESMTSPLRVVVIRNSCNAADGHDLSGAEQDFHTLCAHHDVVHWISIENDVIMWKRSKGDVTTMKPFVLQETCTASNPNCSLDLDDRIILIVEDETSSLQKPSLGTYLATQTKKTHPYFWVLKINLNEHVDLLRETKFKEVDLVSFLMSSSCMDTNCRLEMDFLRFCLQHSRNVIVLMEHFDEIPEECQASVVVCVNQLLMRTRVFQVLVTSSWSTKEMLEESLCTFAYNTRELSLAKDVQKLLRL